MTFTRGTNPRSNLGERRANHRSDTNECADWLQAQFRAKPSKIIADDSGLGLRAAESVKQGRNALTMAHLVSICRADPSFRASFFQFCGGHLDQRCGAGKGIEVSAIAFSADHDGHTYRSARDKVRLNFQLAAVYRAMSDGKWHTLSQIEKITGAPQASISARLRDLRKKKFGAHIVERECFQTGLWFYRLRRKKRRD